MWRSPIEFEVAEFHLNPHSYGDLPPPQMTADQGSFVSIKERHMVGYNPNECGIDFIMYFVVQLHIIAILYCANVTTILASCNCQDNTTYPLWHHKVAYCDITTSLSYTTFHEWGRAVTYALGKQHFFYCKFERVCRLVICKSDRICVLNTFGVKLNFLFLLISTSNFRFETGIHQLNEKVDSSSGFDMI